VSAELFAVARWVFAGECGKELSRCNGNYSACKEIQRSTEVSRHRNANVYGGRSETRIRCTEVPVVPVDFTSEYPTCCALLGLFDVLTAARVTFDDDTDNIRRLIKKISLDRCFHPALWKQFRFFALVQPDNDILPVRTVYDGVTQNIGNNYLTSETPLWFAGCDVIASAIRTGKPPRILRAVRMVPHGKQAGMKSVNLRGSMVEINPYKDDLFRKVIEQRKLNKADKKLYYWLKIFANSIYGFFVEAGSNGSTWNASTCTMARNTRCSIARKRTATSLTTLSFLRNSHIY
jgi:hypothetical protein